MATVTAATGGRTEQLSAVTDRGLTDFPLGKFNQLVSSTLMVPALAYESVTATKILALTLDEFEAPEIHDLLLITQASETLKRTAVSQDWPPTTVVPGSMTDGPDSESRQSVQLFLTGSTALTQVPKLDSNEDW